MQEFSSVTVSSYDADSLAPLLSEKSADGWGVVSIVSAGTNIVAYLQREASGDAPVDDVAERDVDTPAPADDEPLVIETGTVADEAPAEAIDPTPAGTPFIPGAETAAETPSPVEEPAGWASAPESSESSTESSTETAPEPAVVEPEPTPEPAAAAPVESTVPAGWYADPSGRYELRYWDGTAWTEHVSRAGQQFTDPPVA